MFKAPLAQQAVGPNPTDRGKKWKQAPLAGRRAWGPIVDRRDRSQPSCCDTARCCARGRDGQAQDAAQKAQQASVCGRGLSGASGFNRLLKYSP